MFRFSLSVSDDAGSQAFTGCIIDATSGMYDAYYQLREIVKRDSCVHIKGPIQFLSGTYFTSTT